MSMQAGGLRYSRPEVCATSEGRRLSLELNGSGAAALEAFVALVTFCRFLRLRLRLSVRSWQDQTNSS